MFSIGLQGVNYWAVLVAGFITFMLGGVWYTALFGKRWVALHGYTEAQVKEMQARRPPAVFFGGMFVCYLVVALVLAMVFASVRVASAAAGATFGLLLWFGVAAAIRMTDHLSSNKPIGVYAIDASFQLIFLVMMGAILGGWR